MLPRQLIGVVSPHLILLLGVRSLGATVVAKRSFFCQITSLGDSLSILPTKIERIFSSNEIPVLHIFLILLFHFFEDLFHEELFFPCIVDLLQGADEMESGVVANQLVAPLNLFLHEHGGLDVMNFGVGSLTSSLNKVHDGLEGSGVL